MLWSSCCVSKLEAVPVKTHASSSLKHLHTHKKNLKWPIMSIISILYFIIPQPPKFHNFHLLPTYICPFCPPGECVLQRAVMVRKKLTAREGRGWLSGTLFCTHFRVAFVPQDSPKPDVSPCGQLQWFKTNEFELIHCCFFYMSFFETCSSCRTTQIRCF